MKEITEAQKKLVQNLKKLFKSKTISDLEYARLGQFYLTPYSLSKGQAKIFFFLNKLKFLKIYFKTAVYDFYNLLKLENFYSIEPKNLGEFKSIIVNWGTYKDFKYTGEFYDKHFDVSSKKCKDVLWYIIYLDDKLPKRIDKNMILIVKKKSFLNFHYLKKIFLDTLFLKKKIRFLNQEISYHSVFASFINQNFKKFISPKLKRIIMPYEGQPYQNVIFLNSLKMKKKIETIGYIHSFPIGLPTNLLKRPGHPQKLYINGISQKYALENFFGWRNQNLKVLPSARFKKNNKNMNNKIFLPIDFEGIQKILNNLKNLMLFTNTSFSNLQVQNHPSCLKSKKHLKLIKKINALIKNSKSNTKNLSNFSIFIGPTGSVIEALERNVKVFHICENPIIETYTPLVWKFIESFQISENLFGYKKINEQKLVKFNNEKNIYKKYIN